MAQIFQTNQDATQQLVPVPFFFQLEETIKVDKVYIKYENPSEGKTQYQLQQMNFQNKQNLMNVYTVVLQLDYQPYKYQYMLEKNQRTLSEQYFRNFQYPKNQYSQSNENKVDEWNKVWCRYKISQKQQKWIKDYNIFLQKNDDTSLQFHKSTRLLFMYECSERISNETNQIPRKIKLFDTKTNSEFDMEKLYIQTRQQQFMNQIDIEFKIDGFFHEEEALRQECLQQDQQELFNLIKLNAEKEQDCQNQKKQNEILTCDFVILQNQKKENQKKYQNLFKIEKDQIDSLKYKIEQSYREIQQCQRQIEQDKEDNKTIRHETLKRMHMEYEEQRQKLQNEFLKFQKSLDQEIKDFQQQTEQILNQYNQDKEQYENQYKKQYFQLMQQDCEQQVKSLVNSKNQMNEIDETLLSDDIKRELQEYRDKIEDLILWNKDIDFKQNNLKEKNEILLKKKFENFQGKLDESAQILEKLKVEMNKKQQEQENLNLKNEKLNSQIIAFINQVNVQKAQFEQCKQQLKNIKEQYEIANEQNKQLEEQIEKQRIDNELKMKQFQEQINQQKKKFEQESQKKLLELDQKQKNEKLIQQQKFENFNKIQLQQFSHFKKYLKENLLQDFYQLQIQFCGKICQCYSEEIKDFIKDELAELRTKIIQCGELIQHLDFNQFDDIKTKSSKNNEDLDKIIREMNENPNDRLFEELFQQVYKYSLLNENIQQIKCNDLGQDDLEQVDKIRQQMQDLDQGKHKIKSLISSIISTNEELNIFENAANESQQNLDIEFNEHMMRLKKLIETNIES